MSNRFEATLSKETSSGLKKVASEKGLARDAATGFVSLYVSSAKLNPGVYLLTVSPEGTSPSGPESKFRIAVDAVP